MRPRTAERRFTTIKEAAVYAACSEKTIRRRIASGQLTGFRAGPRLLRVDLNELDALLQPIPTAGNNYGQSA